VPFDAEGTPTTRVELIAAGTPQRLVHDRRTARPAGTVSTGHALPGGESFGPVPLNLRLVPGPTSHAELVGDVARGLLVTSFNYCRVLDPRTLVITGLTRNGTFLIEGGEVRGAVRDLRFTQSFLEALAPGNVLGIGSDDRFGDTESGPGLVVAPSLRLASWNFTGGASG
jgi:predicted Zn-dependent protease